jgi:hypothetical protein
MERWAANTLRTIGIILIASFTMMASLLLLVAALCAGMTKNGDPRVWGPFFLGLVVVIGVGGSLSAWLARGVARSSGTASSADGYWPTPPPNPSGIVPPFPQPAPQPHAQPATQPRPAAPRIPLHLSPQSRKAIDRLVLAMGAQIALSALSWIFNQLHFWSAPRAFAPHNWTLVLLAPFVLYHIPYAILMYLLLKRPSRFAFTYALAVPAILILQSLFSLSVVSYYYVHQPMGFLLPVVPWLLHILILVLAYQAIQQIGLHPAPSSLIVAAVITFIFYSMINGITPLLYRMR